MPPVSVYDSVTSIAREAFQSCTSLTSVTIGTNVTYIGYIAFYRCTSLTNVTLPRSVIEGRPEPLVMQMRFHQVQFSVPSGNQQRKEGKARFWWWRFIRTVEPGRVDVPL